MYKDEAIRIMTDTVEQFNRYLGQKYGLTLEQIEENIKKSRVELDYMNGLIYDALKQNGVIL